MVNTMSKLPLHIYEKYILVNIIFADATSYLHNLTRLFDIKSSKKS